MIVRHGALALLAIAWLAFGLAAPAPADEPNHVHVLITPNAAGVTARLALERPVESFMLAYEPDEIRDKTWKLSSPDLIRNGSTISSTKGETFSSVEVEIAALNEPTDALYPCVFRVGAEGLGLYAGYFIGHEPQFATTLEIAPPDGHVVLGFPRGGNTWRVDPAFHHNAGHRYLYVGTRRALSESRYATFVVPPEIVPELAAHIRANVDAAIKFYAAQSGFALPVKPLVLLAANPALDVSQVQGDTTNGPAVALRLFGSNVSAEFDPASQSFDRLIAHEAAHFWNRDTFHPTMESPAWLWEGGAEYWATAARSKVMRMTANARNKHIEQTLNDCIYRLLEGSLGVKRTNATYVCGETVQWLADLFERARTRGRHDIFSVWRRVFAKADANGGVYTLEDFLRAAVSDGADAKAALSLLLAEQGVERWSRLPSLLAPFGVKIEASPPADETLRKITVMHILNGSCRGRRGMWHADDHLELDTGDRCGPLSGDPKVDTVNGRNLFTDMRATFAAVKAACESGGTVSFSRAGSPDTWTTTCTAPLPPAPPNFTIVAGA